ncbi:MAG: DNA recombination protein RmuC [Aquabacterium sp.]|nr:DNA recombination protein RmuC [Ferruginibacter sp.]
MLLYIILTIITLLLILNILLTTKAGKKDTGNELAEIKFSITATNQNLKDAEAGLKIEFTTNRFEAAQTARDLRTEVTSLVTAFGKTIADNISNTSEMQSIQLSAFADQLNKLTKSLEEKLTAFNSSIETNDKQSRSELKENLDRFKNELNDALKDYKEKLRENFGGFEKNQITQNIAGLEKLESLRLTLQTAIKNLQEGNEKKLEEMRNTVDEKLQKTLETRLTQSFELVSKNLESVQKGLGEMQQLAVGVGDLKKVLSNVKTRGILGEVQLSNILEQMLSPEQYEINCITKPGSNNRVEFAIKIPQHHQDNKMLLMPIDSKFPIEAYYALVAAYDAGDIVAAEAAGRALENAIKKSGKDIHEKYICPPDTSEIGLLFLPIEGLYAEAVRRPALMETLQREYQIIVTGPTTLSAILNTISFGYKTMALEQRSGEIKQTLSAVKTEFGKFGDVLKKAQEKINKASEDIDELVGARTKKINAKLRSFEELPAAEVNLLLGETPEE